MLSTIIKDTFFSIWNDPVWSKIISNAVWWVLLIGSSVTVWCLRSISSFVKKRLLRIKDSVNLLHTTTQHEIKEKINEYFSGYFELFQILDSFPALIDRGIYEPDELTKILATEHKCKLRLNDPHALIHSETCYFDKPLTLQYEVTDYATICALRDKNKKPKILSASVVAFNEETRRLFLHRRAGESDTYPNALHTIGGGFMPPRRIAGREDSSLKATMFREFFEELQIGFDLPENTKLLFGTETDTGFIQVVALGVKVHTHDIIRIQPNWEGAYLAISFDDLENTLCDDTNNWVPSGKAHILVWLALGAPNCSPNTKFSGHSAHKLFDRIMSKLARNKANMKQRTM